MAQIQDRSYIITCSIPISMLDFCKENKLKPSKILQDAIADLMGSQKELIALQNKFDLYRQATGQTMQKFADFLHSKNIDFTDFTHFKKDGVN